MAAITPVASAVSAPQANFPNRSARVLSRPATGRLTDYSRSSGSTTATTTVAKTTTPIATTAPETTTPVPTGKPAIVVLKPLGRLEPHPAMGAKAIALARANADVNEIVSPYVSELGWVAQWRGNAWWLAGVFTSQWGKRFAEGAEVVNGQVTTWINHETPPTSWIRANTHRWGLTTIYARFTPAAAIQATMTAVDYALKPYSLLDSAAELVQDAPTPGWYFVFYVQSSAGTKLVIVVTGRAGPSKEGQYAGGYGFGGQSTVQQTVPLNVSDWVHSVAKARGWMPSNL